MMFESAVFSGLIPFNSAKEIVTGVRERLISKTLMSFVGAFASAKLEVPNNARVSIDRCRMVNLFITNSPS
jgi:hypothetical protein